MTMFDENRHEQDSSIMNSSFNDSYLYQDSSFIEEQDLLNNSSNDFIQSTSTSSFIKPRKIAHSINEASSDATSDVHFSVKVIMPPSPKLPIVKRWALRFLQINTIITLLQGYMGVYCAFSLIAIISPQIVATKRVTPSELGTMLSISRFVRIVPKILGGLFVDVFGGKSMFIFGSIICGVSAFLLGLSGIIDQEFGLSKNSLLIWMCLSQVFMQIGTVFGWGSIVKSAGMWFSYNSLGKAMSILALSYLFGDGIARSYLSLFISLGFNWQRVCLVSGGTILLTGFIVHLLLLNSPTQCGLPEPIADPENALGEDGNSTSIFSWNKYDTTKSNLSRIAQPFITIFKLPLFWLALSWYTFLTLVRYVFLDWWSLYMVQVLHASPSVGGFASMIFPFAGGFGSLLFGTIADRIRSYPVHQYGIMIISQIILLGLLMILWISHVFFFGEASFYLTNDLLYVPILIVVFFIGVSTIAPYSLSSLIALRIGGKKLNGTIANIFDGSASIASTLSGLIGGTLIELKSVEGNFSGWSYLFTIGIISNIFSILCLLIIMIMLEIQKNREKKEDELNKELIFD